MQTKLLATLIGAMALMVTPAVAHADFPAPPPIFSDQDNCNLDRQSVDEAHSVDPQAHTPERVAKAWLQAHDAQGSYDAELRVQQNHPEFGRHLTKQQMMDRDYNQMVNELRQCHLPM